jgi:signal transduction histidine kinase
VLVLLLVVSAAAPATAAPERPVTVLLMYAESSGPGFTAQDEALRTTLQAELPHGVFFHQEHLDPTPLPLSAQASLVQVLRHKYSGRPIDLVITSTSVGLRFVLDHRSELFPDVPVVFMSVNRAAVADRDLGGNVSGSWLLFDWAGTLDLALRLQPGTRRVAVVTGASRRDQLWLATAREQLAPYRDRLEIRYLPAPSLTEVLGELRRLPADAVVLLGTFLQDGTGRDYVGADVAARVVEAAPVAVYGLLDTLVGRGIVGGRTVSPAAQGTQAARLALRVLAGETPGPPVAIDGVNTVDWRQLERWRIDVSRLPADSVVRFRTPSTWGLYKWYVAGGAALLVVQSIFIAGLLASRARRKRAERTLAERLQFETLLSEMSAEFLTVPTRGIDDTIARMLRRVGEALDFDRAVVTERDEGTSTMRPTHRWTRAGVPPVPTAPMAAVEEFPWISARLSRGEVVELSRLDALPAEASTDARNLAARGVCALAAVPLVVDSAVSGALAFSRLSGARGWPDGVIDRLRLLADIFASVLARRRADSALRESQERLHLAEEETQRQRDELAHALRVSTLGELTASIAHEINQPLSAILMNSQVMLQNLAAGRAQPDELKDVFTDIAHDTKRLSQTVHRLRSLFRKNQTERVAIDVNALIDDVLGLLESDLLIKNIAVRFKRGAALPSVPGDPVQLRQVVLNLIVNAAEAVALVENGPEGIRIETHRSGVARLTIAVRDSGVGVDESELERIFERFVSSKPQGLGMGLAISRSIVQAHGGRIWATRNDDRGLTLTVELPLSE